MILPYYQRPTIQIIHPNNYIYYDYYQPAIIWDSTKRGGVIYNGF